MSRKRSYGPAKKRGICKGALKMIRLRAAKVEAKKRKQEAARQQQLFGVTK